ncbi:MAG: glycosyltransferase [Bacteroidota bacterium]
MQPLISVYITNHNYGRFISQAVESVLAQTISDYEIIIIDDGSSDNSREIIEKYAEYDNIKIILQNKHGLNVTNNIAMRAASGKYIMRLDADDYLDHNALLVMSNKLESDSELGLVFPDYYLVDEGGAILSLEKRHDFSTEVKVLDQPAHGACTMIRREFLMQLNGYDERYECQDGYELWIKFINHFKVDNVATPLFYYRQHGNNLTSNENKILNTRSKIKHNFAQENGKEILNAVAILPIRDYKNSRDDLAFTLLGDKKIIDWKIESALESRYISKIIVTSPDTRLKEHINNTYRGLDDVIFVFRDPKLTRLNTDLTGTIDHVIYEVNDQLKDANTILLSGLEFPFITAAILDDAINTLSIFDTDSLISVRPETNLFFQHDGEGMKSILNQEKFTKLEREALYRYTGGISAVRLDYYEKNKKVIGGKVGHIIIDQKSSQGIFTSHDKEIAQYIASKILSEEIGRN